MSCKLSLKSRLLVFLIGALLAFSACRKQEADSESRSEESSGERVESRDVAGKDPAQAEEPASLNGDPTAWLVRDDERMPVRGAIVYQSDRLLRFFLSSKSLSCTADDSSERISIDVVSRLQPEGPPGWRIHDRSAQRALSDPAGDPPVQELKPGKSMVELTLDATPVKHEDFGFMTLSGHVKAQRCPGEIPGQSTNNASPASGDLKVAIGDETLDIRGAILREQHGDRFSITLSPMPLDCDPRGELHGVVVDLFYTSLKRAPSGLSLHGERIRGHHNGVGNTLQSSQTPEKGGLDLVIAGSARVGPFNLTFSGDGIHVKDCRATP